MVVTEEIFNKAKSMLKTDIREDWLREVLGILQDESMIPMMMPLIAEAAKDLPKELTPEEAKNRIIAKLQKKADSKKEGNPANAKIYTRKYLDSIWLEQRLMGAKVPNTQFELFGETFDTPIMTAALSHLKVYNPEIDNAMAAFAKAAADAHAVHWVGMGENDEFAQITETGAKTIRIIKPYEDESKIFDQIRFSKEHGALAVGMDIDHVFTEDGNLDVCVGEQLSVKTLEQLQSYVEASDLPFVIKGVLSVHDALACREIGADGIVVSNHGGRMQYAVPSVMLLEDIRKAVGSDMKIFTDSGFASGADVYKGMALGADAVSIGTHLVPYLKKGGAAAVTERIAEMTKELRGFMANTGVSDVTKFDRTVLHRA